MLSTPHLYRQHRSLQSLTTRRRPNFTCSPSILIVPFLILLSLTLSLPGASAAFTPVRIGILYNSSAADSSTFSWAIQTAQSQLNESQLFSTSIGVSDNTFQLIWTDTALQAGLSASPSAMSTFIQTSATSQQIDAWIASQSVLNLFTSALDQIPTALPILAPFLPAADFGSGLLQSSNNNAVLSLPPSLFRLSSTISSQIEAMLGIVHSLQVISFSLIVDDDTASTFGSVALERFQTLSAQRGMSITSTVRVSASLSQSDISNRLQSLSVTAPSTASDAFETLGPVVLTFFQSDAGSNSLSLRVFHAASALNIQSGAWHNASQTTYLWLLNSDVLNSLSSSTTPSSTDLFFPSTSTGVPTLDGILGVSPALGLFRRDDDIYDAWIQSTFVSASQVANNQVLAIDESILFAYDAVFAYRMAMENYFSLGSDSNSDWRTVAAPLGGIQASLLNVSFLGASGAIQFSSTHERSNPRYELNQFSLNYATTYSELNPRLKTVAHWSTRRGLVLMPEQVFASTGASSGLPATVLSSSNTFAAFLAAHPLGEGTELRWTPVPSSGVPPSPRYGACTVLSAPLASLFVLGGTFSSTSTPSDEVWSFSLVDELWANKPVLEKSTGPDARFYGGCTLSGNYIYVFGGISDGGIKGDLWRFKIDTSSWSLIPFTASSSGLCPATPLSATGAPFLGQEFDISPLNGRSQRSQFGFTGGADALFMIGGRHRSTREAELWQYDIVDNVWNIEVPNYDPNSRIQSGVSYTDKTAVMNMINTGISPVLGRGPFQGRDTVFLISGYTQSAEWVFCYDVLNNTITPLQSKNGVFPNYRALIPANFVRNKLWISHGWDENANVNVRDVWSFSLECPGPNCATWTKESQFADQRDSVMSVRYGDSLLTVGGWGIAAVHNDFWSLHSRTREVTQVHDDVNSPSARKSHSACLVNNKMYIYGGKDSSGNALSDFWAFDLQNEKWIQVVPANTVSPGARYGHVAATLHVNMYVQGGFDGTSYLNDMYMYSPYSNKWSLISFSQGVGQTAGLLPPPRMLHSVVTTDDITLFITGGTDSSHTLADLWSYRAGSGTWIQLLLDANALIGSTDYLAAASLTNNTDSTVYTPVYHPRDPTSGNTPVAVANAAALVVDNRFYYIGGRDATFNPYAQVWVVDISAVALASSAKQIHWYEKAPLPHQRSEHVVVASGDFLYLYGGIFFEELMVDLLAYSITADTWITIDPTHGSAASSVVARGMAGASLIVSGTSMLLFGGSTAEFDNAHLESYLLNEMWRLHFLPPCGDGINSPVITVGSDFNQSSLSNLCSPCSAGTTLSNAMCVFCAAGWYKSDSGSDDCTPCPPKFYGAFEGASSASVCIPCPFGSYSDVSGLSECKACPADKFCPVGSSQPISDLTVESDSFFHIQPDPMEQNAAVVNRFTTIFSWILLAILLVLVIGYAYLMSGSYVQANYLAKYDWFFTHSHSNHLNEPMYRRQTSMGGVCTVLTCFILLFIIISLSLTYFLNNDIERRALVPSVIIQEPIRSNVRVNVTLRNYLPSCIYDPTADDIVIVGTNANIPTGPNPCHPDVNFAFDTESWSGAWNVQCFKTQQTNSTANDLGFNTDSCLVVAACLSCVSLHEDNTLNFTFLEADHTFASAISWSIEASSGYPNQDSVVGGLIVASNNSVIRGVNAPSVISVHITPTLHTVLNSNKTDSGYHVDLSAQAAGQEVSPQNFHSENGVIVVLDLAQSLYTLNIQIESRQTGTQFVGYLIASLVGVLAGLAMVMVILEKIENVVLSLMGKKPLGSEGRLKTILNKTRAQMLLQAVNVRGNKQQLKQAKLDAIVAAAADRTNNGAPRRSSLVTPAHTGMVQVEKPRPFVKLPYEFLGAKDLTDLPPLLEKPLNNITLPSRLEMLGKTEFAISATTQLVCIANSVLGYVPTLVQGKYVKAQLVLLPSVFSKSLMRMSVFLRLLALVLVTLFLISFFHLASVDPGRVWVIGTLCAVWVMYELSSARRTPDGVMQFCRSLGAPEYEEYMFSYSWRHDADNVRTLAKALWHAGVGVWIDVLKLTPGTEIRPMLRTVIHKVHRVVIFLSPDYINSPNCCLEMLAAVQQPEKCIFCIIKPIDKSIIKWLRGLKGSKIINGFMNLMQTLDEELRDQQNFQAYQWWRNSRISGAGVPSVAVPTAEWPMPKFSLAGKFLLPSRSAEVGPVYLAGDCLSAGVNLKLPWLFIIAVVGVAVNVADLTVTYVHDGKDGYPTHSKLDYFWLCCILLCNLAPFFAFKHLFETRRTLSVCLRPLLASRSMGGGVRVKVWGSSDDNIVKNLRLFLNMVGHNADRDPLGTDPFAAILSEEELAIARAQRAKAKSEERARGILKMDEEEEEDEEPIELALLANTSSKNIRSGSQASSELTAEVQSLCINIRVLDSLASRAEYFGSDVEEGAYASDIFVWSGAGDPFSEDEIGKRMMRFLVLVAGWERENLAEAVFSAVGVRVVDALHQSLTPVHANFTGTQAHPLPSSTTSFSIASPSMNGSSTR